MLLSMETIKQLTHKEELFCQEYIKDFNGTQAAIRAGYSPKTARSIASENLTKPYIKARIKVILDDIGLTKEAVTKMFEDISTSNLSNYMKVVKVERSQPIKMPLQDLINQLRDEVDFEDDYAMNVSFDAKELKLHEKSQQNRRRRIIRLKLELERNPGAYRIVQSKPDLVEDVEIDMIALVKDKERGKIKAIKNTRFGVDVELESISTALTNVARMQGLYVDHAKLDVVNHNVTVTEEEAKAILKAIDKDI